VALGETQKVDRQEEIKKGIPILDYNEKSWRITDGREVQGGGLIEEEKKWRGGKSRDGA